MTERVLWRISNFKDLSGIGGTKVSGRWHSKGRPIVYLADWPATSLLEVLVHLELTLDELPEYFTLLRVQIPERVAAVDCRESLAEDWKADVMATRKIGDDWLQEEGSLLLRVPTAIVPANCNYLFNPQHPDAGLATLTSFDFPADKRLF
ncbi:RES family NAD+ phosphorylase [Pseudomonas sp. NA-150]|uniref:RES family NAD+ phosphorylase n=1 Tax=Pseudomonas sp. NA-150 TaxID=3367525 RepID=UPI0037C8116C